MATYKVIGGDRKEYGPVTEDEVRQWIAEGRLSDQSVIQTEGASEWGRLSALPQFAEALAAQVRAAPALPPSTVLPGDSTWSALILSRRPELHIGRCLSRAGKLWFANFGLFFAAIFPVWAIATVCQFNFVGLTLYGVLQGVFYGGLYLVFLRRIRNQPATPADAFSGFRMSFAQLLLAGFLTNLLVWVGLTPCCLIVPGIYLFVAWTFSVPLVADKRLEFWSAMETSRRVATRVWPELFALIVLAFLPIIAVNIALQVKMFSVLAPVIQRLNPSETLDIHHLTEMLTQAAQTAKITLPLILAAKAVYLINLPFALGALMYAYEDLFGDRSTPGA